jgi:hypothetical protein
MAKEIKKYIDEKKLPEKGEKPLVIVGEEEDDGQLDDDENGPKYETPNKPITTIKNDDDLDLKPKQGAQGFKTKAKPKPKAKAKGRPKAKPKEKNV